MRRRSDLVALHPEIPVLSRAALDAALDSALAAVAPHPSERFSAPAEPLLRAAFATFLEASYADPAPWRARRLRGKGAFAASCGVLFGLAISGAPMLERYGPVRTAVARLASDAARGAPRHRSARTPWSTLVLTYLESCFRRGVASGHALGRHCAEAIPALALPADPASALLIQAARRELFLWLDPDDAPMSGDAEADLRRYLHEEYVVGFALGYLGAVPSSSPREAVLDAVLALPGLAAAVTRLADQRAAEAGHWVRAELARATGPFMPLMFLRSAVDDGQRAREGAASASDAVSVIS